MTKAKPFIKWVGGKNQLIEQLNALLPADFDKWEDAVYIEPFVGGGAMLFYILQRYTNIHHAVINDINSDLATCYRTIRDMPEELIKSLQKLEDTFLALPNEERKSLYLTIRDRYNQKGHTPVENTTMFLFMNRTCFNGLYRVNKKGKFNVPFGRYAHPKICDAETIRRDSQLLQSVEILNGDFTASLAYAKGPTLFYFDPPYRPLTQTSSFTDYSQQSFDDEDQIRLKKFCDQVHEAGHHFMLSNSDGKAKEETDDFLDNLYHAYEIERVWASRSINCNPNKRGKLSEIVVHNYASTKANSK